MGTRAWLPGLICAATFRCALAAEDIGFVAEHLPEVAMDDRYAVLPLGVPADCAADTPWQFTAGYLQASAGSLEIAGPMLGLAYSWQLSPRWQLGLFAFADDLAFVGDSARPLAVEFSNEVPLALPADAVLTDLDGTALDVGFGGVFKRHTDSALLGSHEWFAGLLIQRIALNDYGGDYLIESGPDAGTAGHIDHSGDYDHITPFAGLEVHRNFGSWSLHPRLLVAVPLPRRTVYGRITGPGFDIAGDTESAGRGKHFGDPSLTLGLGMTYEPYGLTLDIGSTISQALLEPEIHKGVDQNWLLSLECVF
jgi:hypothetical protein